MPRLSSYNVASPRLVVSIRSEYPGVSPVLTLYKTLILFMIALYNQKLALFEEDRYCFSK